MDRIIEALARFTTSHRALAVGLFVALAGAMALGIPRLEVDPTPQKFTASSIADQARVARQFRAHFGNPDHVVIVLVEADDVLSDESIAYVHRLSTAFAGKPYVDRVDSITVTPLPLRGEAPAPSEESLEDLDDLEDLEEPAVAPELEDALGALVQAAPERFPMGLGTIADRLSTMRYGPAVEGPTVEPEERERLLRALDDAPLIEGRLLGRDRHVTAVALTLDEQVEHHAAMEDAVDDIDATLARNGPPRGIEVEVGGLPHLFHAIVVKLRTDNLRMVPGTLFVCFLLLFLSFRWLPGTVLPLIAVGLTTLCVIGAMGLLGEPMDVLNNIIAPLLIIIGVQEAIHVVGRYREELERGLTRTEAIQETVRHMALASFLTVATTAVGLASLVTSQTAMLRRFGLIAGAGVMFAYFVTIVFLPAALSFFAVKARPPKKQRGMRHIAHGWIDAAITGLTLHIIRRPWGYLVGAAALTALCIWGSLHVRVDSALLDELDETDAQYGSTLLMEEQLDGVRPLEIMLTARESGRFHDPAVLAVMDSTQRWLAQQEGVLSTLSASDYLHESWARVSGDPRARTERFRSEAQVEAIATLLDQAEPSPLRAVLSEDGRVTRIQVRLADIGARKSLHLIEALRRRLRRQYAPLEIDVAMTGEGYTGSIGLDAIVNDLLGSLGTAVLIIFGMMVVLFRSVRLGLLSVPPNVIPLVGAMAWMALRGIPMNAATVIIFSISLGLAVDASIHMLARYREEVAKGIAWRSGILRSARGTGHAIVVSCSTLMFGFGVMLLSSFVPVRRFGELIAVSIFLSLVSTLIVQPAMLRVGLGRRASRRIGQIARTETLPPPRPSRPPRTEDLPGE